jgi:hypothetical protein
VAPLHLSVKGSSGIQIVANLQPRVKSLINYVRGKTWISAMFLLDRQSELSGDKETPNCKIFPIYPRKGWPRMLYGQMISPRKILSALRTTMSTKNGVAVSRTSFK